MNTDTMTAQDHDAARHRINFELLSECNPVARRFLFARSAMHRAAARELRRKASTTR